MRLYPQNITSLRGLIIQQTQTFDLLVNSNENNVLYCEQKGRNLVRPRGDNFNLDPLNAERPWSLKKEDFSVRKEVKPINNSSELLSAIKYGRRIWLDPVNENKTSIEKETFKSYFVPHQFHIPPLSSAQACDIMAQYSHFILFGDSLTRHMSQGLFMILRNDVVLGGINSGVTNVETNPYKYCKCDGQFSESEMCRKNDGVFNGFKTHYEANMCSHLEQTFSFYHSGFSWGDLNCGDPNNRGVFLFIQGGVHYLSDWEKTVNGVVDPLLKSSGFEECAKANKINVSWGQYNSQSRSLDDKYPLQTRENALKFNENMARHFEQNLYSGIKVHVIDWWNFTKDAQTSDGFHYLSDINIFKAYHVLHLATLTRKNLQVDITGFE